jgi:hypothetical protein
MSQSDCLQDIGQRELGSGAGRTWQRNDADLAHLALNPYTAGGADPRCSREYVT